MQGLVRFKVQDAKQISDPDDIVKEINDVRSRSPSISKSFMTNQI